MDDKHIECPPDASTLFTEVTILMPTSMYDELRARAKARGTIVENLIMRATELDGELFGGPTGSTREIILRPKDGSAETIIRPFFT